MFFACPRGSIERAPDSCGSCRVMITCLKFLNHWCTTLSGFQTVFHYLELLESECDTRMPLNDRSAAKCANVASIQKRPSHIKCIWREHYCDDIYTISIHSYFAAKPFEQPQSPMLLFFVLRPHDGTPLVQRRLDGVGMCYSLFLRPTCHAAPVHLYRRTRDSLSDTVAG